MNLNESLQDAIDLLRSEGQHDLADAVVVVLSETGVQHIGDIRGDMSDLNTSEGGRHYVAEFFARELRRHDFGRYITTTLAADFACALAQYLAVRKAGAAGILEGWALVDLSNHAILPQLPSTRMIDAGWPNGELISDCFDSAGAYADLLAASRANGGGIVHGKGRAAEAVATELWAMHLQGPDDIHAAPSKVEALEVANAINREFARSQIRPYAVVVRWSGSTEQHAQSLADWEDQWEQGKGLVAVQAVHS